MLTDPDKETRPDPKGRDAFCVGAADKEAHGSRVIEPWSYLMIVFLPLMM